MAIQLVFLLEQGSAEYMMLPSFSLETILENCNQSIFPW
jgi:hypothetical protein